MSDPRFPPELFDHIVDLLHDHRGTLKQCCLISKSWVPRTRKHLFGEIVFQFPVDIDTWKQMFPDPSNSPAYYARSLFFGSMKAIAAIVEEEDGWVRAFPSVVRLVVRSVDTMSSPRQVLALICSLPLLRDLDMGGISVADTDRDDSAFQPWTSPPLNGILTICQPHNGLMIYRPHGTKHFIRLLSDLPNGIRFREFKFMWDLEEDLLGTTTLVEACSNTLEHVDIESWVYASNLGGPSKLAASIDFSTATRLKRVAFRFHNRSIVWATMALKTITSMHKDFMEVSIYIPFDFRIPYAFDPPIPSIQVVEEEIGRQWMDLDCLLVQLHESHAICVKVVGRKKETREYVEGLLPEMTRRASTGLVDFR